MTRTHLTIVGAAVVVAALALGAIVTLGGGPGSKAGPAFARAEGLRWGWVNERTQHRRHRGTVDGSGPEITRVIPWPDYEILALDVPADVHFVQTEGPGTVRVTGPSGTVEQVILHRGLLHFRDHVRNRGLLDIVVTAPRITRFELSGQNRLTLENYKQDRLKIDATGDAQVAGKGSTGALDLYVSGAGRVNLSDLTAEAAEVEVASGGKAQISAVRWAGVYVSGTGEVTLTREPKQLEAETADTGRVVRLAQAGTNRSATPLLQ